MYVHVIIYSVEFRTAAYFIAALDVCIIIRGQGRLWMVQIVYVSGNMKLGIFILHIIYTLIIYIIIDIIYIYIYIAYPA